MKSINVLCHAMYNLNCANNRLFDWLPVEAVQIQTIGSFNNEGFFFHGYVLNKIVQRSMIQMVFYTVYNTIWFASVKEKNYSGKVVSKYKNG